MRVRGWCQNLYLLLTGVDTLPAWDVSLSDGTCVYSFEGLLLRLRTSCSVEYRGDGADVVRFKDTLDRLHIAVVHTASTGTPSSFHFSLLVLI